MIPKERLTTYLEGLTIYDHAELWNALAAFEVAEAIRELKNVLEVDLVNPYLLKEDESKECKNKMP